MTPTFDADALSRFACTDESEEVVILYEIDWAGIDTIGAGTIAFPVTWREPNDEEEDAGLLTDENDYERYRLRIPRDDRRAFVAILDEVTPARWSYFGSLVPWSDETPATLLLSEYGRRTHDAETLFASRACGVKVLVHKGFDLAEAVQLRSGGERVAVYVGFDGDDRACAVIFDAATIGKLSDPRTLDSPREEQTRDILDLRPGTHTIHWQYRYEDFVPNLAPDALPIADRSRSFAVTAVIAGELPLRTRRMARWSARQSLPRDPDHEWAVAADRLEVLRCSGPGGELVGWSLRVPGAVAHSWTTVGFEDDCCFADASMEPSAIPLTPTGEDLVFLNAAVVSVVSSSLSIATAAIALDADGRLVSLTVAL